MLDVRQYSLLSFITTFIKYTCYIPYNAACYPSCMKKSSLTAATKKVFIKVRQRSKTFAARAV